MLKYKYVVGLILLLVGVAASGVAQPEEPYVLQPDDQIAVRVFNEAQFGNQAITIGPNGFATIPFAGPVQAAGKTTGELEEDIRELLIQQLRLRDPIVSVSIVAYRPIVAAIVGAVRAPGTYSMRPGDTLANLIARAGAIPIDGSADLRRATLTRKGSEEQIPLDLYALLQLGDLSQDYEVQDGDILNVPPGEDLFVNVWGSVRSPQSMRYIEGMSVLDAVTRAGGEIPRVSKFSGVRVLRPDPQAGEGQFEIIKVNLVAFLDGKDARQNVKLEPGDTIVVPDAGNIDFAFIRALADLAFLSERIGLDVLPRF
jgi:polysaccharide export outer membrane protein